MKIGLHLAFSFSLASAGTLLPWPFALRPPTEVGCTEACHGNGACLDSRCAAPRRIAR